MANEQATETEAPARFWKLKIVRDGSPMSPLDEEVAWFTFAGWHRRYTIGNEQPKCEPQEYLAELQAEHGDTLILLPVYMHDHGGCEYRCRAFNDTWDSGQVGYIWTTKASMADAGFSDASIADTSGVEAMLRATVRLYSDWASGDVWGYVVTEYERCPHCNESREVGDGDACWGFIGSDKDAQDTLRAEVPSEVKHLFDKAWSDRE